MLTRTPEMLKKSGIKKEDILAFIVRIVHVYVWKQSAVKRREAVGGKEEEPALIVVSWMKTQRFLPLPYRLPYPQ